MNHPRLDPGHSAFPSADNATHGLTKRELIATWMMTFMQSNTLGDFNLKEVYEKAARNAILKADALIAELNQP